MKIQRTINGIVYSIELLPEELEEAWREQQKVFDVEDLVKYGESFGSDDFEEQIGCTPEEFHDWKEEIAEEMRGLISMQDLSVPEARDSAIQKVVFWQKTLIEIPSQEKKNA